MLEEVIRSYHYNLILNDKILSNRGEVYKGLSYHSILYLELIAYKEKCTPGYLAEVLKLSKPTVTIKLNHLIEQGLVRKTQSKTDKRVYYLTISPEVEESRKIYDKRFQAAEQKLQDKYRPEEIIKFCEMLETVRDCFEEDVK